MWSKQLKGGILDIFILASLLIIFTLGGFSLVVSAIVFVSSQTQKSCPENLIFFIKCTHLRIFINEL